MNLMTENPATTLIWVARSMLGGKSMGTGPEHWAVTHHAPQDALRLIRRGVMPAGSTSDAEWGATEFRNASNAFLQSLQTQSVFFRLLSDNAFLRIPLRTRVGSVTLNATAWVRGEGKPTPLSRIRLLNSWLEPISAVGLMVVTRELIDNVTAAGQIAFNKALRQAVAAVVDQRFLETIIDSNTPTIDSVGSDEAAIDTDMRELLLAVTSDGSPSLFFIMSADVAKRACTFVQKFPALSATGGEAYNLPVIVSNVIPDGTIYLVNAAAIAADAGEIRLRTSSEADVEMLDLDSDLVQDATAGAGATMVSLWQANAVGLMAAVDFACERLRDDALAVLQNVQWGGEQSA